MQLFSLAFSAGYLALALGTPISLEDRTYGCPLPAAGYLKSVKSQFSTDQIVPDLIERINPTLRIDPSYGTKKVQLGTYFTTLETVSQPTFTLSAEAKHDPAKTTYSLFLLDPDVPQRGSATRVTFAHWILSHVHPNCANNQTSQATTLLYEAPTPASTTQHRYTFLIYREPPGYVPDTVALQLRTPFDINDYVEAHNLTLVGGNFFKEAIDNGLQGGK